MTSSSGFGRVVVITGAEPLLVERATAEVVAAARAAAPELEMTEVEAARLDPQRLAEVTTPSLFAARRAAVITEMPGLPAEMTDDLMEVTRAGLDDLVLVLVADGGARGKTWAERLKKAGAEVVDCPAPKPWELPQFVAREAKRSGGSATTEAAGLLVEAVGSDLRALAAAAAQLVADAPGGEVAGDQVRRYFAGRAEVTSFAVADAALAGRTGTALAQLRWAMTTGVVPVLVTSALASGLRGLGKLATAPGGLRDTDLAREVGVPAWKLKSMRSQARGWDPVGIAQALQAVALADAEVKGAADDPAYALERAVIAVSRARGRG